MAEIEAKIGEVFVSGEDPATTRWSSRKFWAAMVWEFVMAWLFCKDILDQSGFVTLTYLLLGGYFLSNLSQRWINLAEKK